MYPERTDWGGTEEKLILRKHCQHFSRLGWALFAYMAAMLVVQAIISIPVYLLHAELLDNPLFLWGLSVISSYGAGLPAFCLVLRGTWAPALPNGRPLRLSRFVQLYLLTLGVLYLANSATLVLMGLIGALRGSPVVNPIESIAAFPPILTCLLSCVFAPIAEEFIFRWMLLRRLLPYGERFAVLASSLCFALFHANFYQMFYAFAIGIVLGCTALYTGKLWPAILLHAMVNFISAGLVPLLEPLGDAGNLLVDGLVIGSMILGAIFFPLLRRKIRFQPGTISLQHVWRVFFETPGTVCFIIASLGIAVLYFL